MSSNARTVVLAYLRAVGGFLPGKALLERLGWALAPSNEPKAEALTPIQRLRDLMGDLEFLKQVRRERSEDGKSLDSWQALDRWERPIEKVRTIRIKATATVMPSEFTMSTERPEAAAKRKAREEAAAEKERSSRRTKKIPPEKLREHKAFVLKRLEEGESIVGTSRELGFAESTIRAWMERDASFLHRVKKILAEAPRATGKASSMTPEQAETIRQKRAAGWGNKAIADLLGIKVSRARGYIEQVERAA